MPGDSWAASVKAACPVKTGVAADPVGGEDFLAVPIAAIATMQNATHNRACVLRKRTMVPLWDLIRDGLNRRLAKKMRQTLWR
jgi:hypothetical protein